MKIISEAQAVKLIKSFNYIAGDFNRKHTIQLSDSSETD